MRSDGHSPIHFFTGSASMMKFAVSALMGAALAVWGARAGEDPPAPAAERSLPAAAEDLVGGLADADAKFAERCAARLVDMGAKGVEALKQAVVAGEDSLGVASLKVLAKVLEKDQKKLADICGACLSVKRPGTSAAAMAQLGALGQRSSTGKLMAFLMVLEKPDTDRLARFQLERVCVSALEAITGRRFVFLFCNECARKTGLTLGAPCPNCGAQMVVEMPAIDQWIAWWTGEQANPAATPAPAPKEGAKTGPEQ
jgi:hypothetical protein